VLVDQQGNKAGVLNFGKPGGAVQVIDDRRQLRLGVGEEIIGGTNGFVGKVKKLKCSKTQREWYPKDYARR